MTRTAFDHQLADVQEDMLIMAGLVQTAVERGIDALKNGNLELAHQIVADDADIDRKRYEIEEKCLELIATQQPLAGDLRTIVSVLQISVDLERMGDHAEGIAKIAIMLADEPPLKPYIDITRMAEAATEMLMSGIEAFKQRDSQLARKVCDQDDVVDQLYEQVYHELIADMIKDPRSIQRATYLTWVAHNLERIADRATNICERVVYLVEGHIQDLNTSKY